jgi:macrolide-specific efflux system membrane fusion protein
MRRTRRQWLLNTGLGVGLAAVVGAGVLISTSGNASGSDSSALRTVAVRTGDVTAAVSADGSVEAVNEVAANFETSGTITTLTVKVGDTVTKGERIATIDSAAAQRSLEVARLQLSSAKEQLSSAEDGTTTTDPTTHVTTTTVNASQVASAKAQVIQAQATYDDAKDTVAATSLYAPISGTVLEVNGKVGQSTGSSSGSSGSTTPGSTTSSSSDLVVIANLAALQVSVSVPESDIGSLAVGQAATVTFPAVSGASAKGKITSIDPVGTTANSVVTFGVVVRLSGVPKTIRLGQSASVTITTDSATGALIVPSTAVTTNGSRSTVLLLKNGQQVRTEVTVGVAGDSWTQITKGVSAGDEVVLTTSTSTSGSSSNQGFPGGGFAGGGVIPGGGAVPGGRG